MHSSYSFTSDMQQRYDESQQCLSGQDADGRKTHPAFTDHGIFSLAEGGGIRRPHPSIIGKIAELALDQKRLPIESYTNYDLFDGFYPAVSDHFKSWGIAAELADNIVFGLGTHHLFNTFLALTCKPGDVILAPMAFYHAFVLPLKAHGVTLHCIKTSAAHDYKIQAAELQMALANLNGKRAAALLLISPTPIGAVYSHDELAALARVIAAHRLPVFHDAVFKELEFDTAMQHPVPASFAEIADLVVTAGSPAKLLGAANLRMGWACGSKTIIDAMVKRVINEVSTLPQLNQGLALTALQTPAAYKAANINEAKQRAAILVAGIARIGERLQKRHNLIQPPISVAVEPKAGFSILLNCNPLAGLSRPDGQILRHPLDLVRWFLENGIGLSPAWSCGFDDFHVRIAFADLAADAASKAAAPQELAAVLAAIEPALRSLGEAECATAIAAVTARLTSQTPTDPFAAGRRALETLIDIQLFNAIDSLLAAQSVSRMVAAE